MSEYTKEELDIQIRELQLRQLRKADKMWRRRAKLGEKLLRISLMSLGILSGLTGILVTNSWKGVVFGLFLMVFSVSGRD